MSQNIDAKQGILLESGTNEVEFLQFSVCKQNYGINVGKVRQILSFTDDMITDLPGEMESITGLFYFRGKPTPIINLKDYLKIKDKVEKDKVERKLLIVTEINQHTTAFVIDEVHGIFRTKWTEFQTLESDVFHSHNINVVGSVRVNEVVVLILDVESLLADLIPSVSIESQIDNIPTPRNNERRNLRILYCEDSTIIQKMLMMTLQKAGFEKLKVFSTGEDGYNHLKNHSDPLYDIILSDIEMPKMDGLTFCKEVRNIPCYKSIPIIFFSSMISEEMKLKCQAIGGTAAFSKPEINKIIAEIDKIFDIK